MLRGTRTHECYRRPGVSPLRGAPVLTLVLLLIPHHATGSPQSAFPLDPYADSVAASPGDRPLLQGLARDSAGGARISYHARTGRVRFIGTETGRAIRPADPRNTEPPPEEAARAFLEVYGGPFGLADQAQDLRLLKSRRADGGRSSVRFQQLREGIPVLGGELILQTDLHGDVLSAHGELLPGENRDSTPTVGALAVRETALRLVADRHRLAPDDLTATVPELWLYNPVLLGPGRNITRLVWRMEVTSKQSLPVRELVLVDARSGRVALHFNQVETVMNREIWDDANRRRCRDPGCSLARSEGAPPRGISDVDLAYDYSGDTWDFYHAHHGRDLGLDADGTMTVTVRYCPLWRFLGCPYRNAFWDGKQVVFGQGFSGADDVVAHEWTHAVT